MVRTGVSLAIRHLRQAGFTIAGIADRMAVHPSSVYRWAATTHQPTPTNLAALRAFISDLRKLIGDRPRPGRSQQLFAAAAEALMSDVDRAEQARFEQEMRDRQAAIVAAREAEQAQVARPSYRSITCDVDPFTLVDSEPALPF